jgi:DNA polymerase-3 subunit delta
MRIAADRLAASLTRNLGPLYVIAGDEPLIADECREAIRAAACGARNGERHSHVAERGFDWAEFSAGLQNLSLFATYRLIELRIPTGKPGDAGAAALVGICAKPPADTTIVVSLPALDSASARTKWATRLMEAACWVEVRTPGPEQLRQWLTRRLEGAQLSADADAIDALMLRTEGNLLAARQEIDKLALLAPTGRVSAETVRDSVADGARFDVYELADAALLGDANRALRVLGGLEREGTAAALILWSLVRETLTLAEILARMAQGDSEERALQAAGVWRRREELYRRALRNRRPAEAPRLLQAAARADQVLKGARHGDTHRAVTELTLTLAGSDFAAVETA